MAVVRAEADALGDAAGLGESDEVGLGESDEVGLGESDGLGLGTGRPGYGAGTGSSGSGCGRTISADPTGRSGPDGLFTIPPSTHIVVEPPPSRFNADRAPRCCMSSANSTGVIPTDFF
jgi:hypothetical protein